MGVPIFNIILGFFTGLYVGWKIVKPEDPVRTVLLTILIYSVVTSLVTFLLMAVLWLPAIRMLWDPAADIENFGTPMILYEPVASFIGWIWLMVVISPFLQMLMGVFGGLVGTAFLGEKKTA
jgi:sterol desaturase/sphingolipid hydroxylase (fatty acid hydroxylase superfamily)